MLPASGGKFSHYRLQGGGSLQPYAWELAVLVRAGRGTMTAFVTMELAVLVRAGRGTMTAFVTMERAGLVPQGGKIESLTIRAKRVAAGVRLYNEKPKATKRGEPQERLQGGAAKGGTRFRPASRRVDLLAEGEPFVLADRTGPSL